MNIFQKAKWLLYLNKISKDKTMIEKLKSRKLWITVGVAALTTLLSNLGISSELINEIINLAMTYVVVQGTVDATTILKKEKS